MEVFDEAQGSLRFLVFFEDKYCQAFWSVFDDFISKHVDACTFFLDDDELEPGAQS